MVLLDDIITSELIVKLFKILKFIASASFNDLRFGISGPCGVWRLNRTFLLFLRARI
jgi:hypothetical protein